MKPQKLDPVFKASVPGPYEHVDGRVYFVRRAKNGDVACDVHEMLLDETGEYKLGKRIDGHTNIKGVTMGRIMRWIEEQFR